MIRTQVWSHWLVKDDACCCILHQLRSPGFVRTLPSSVTTMVSNWSCPFNDASSQGFILFCVLWFLFLPSSYIFLFMSSLYEFDWVAIKQFGVLYSISEVIWAEKQSWAIFSYQILVIASSCIHSTHSDCESHSGHSSLGRSLSCFLSLTASSFKKMSHTHRSMFGSETDWVTVRMLMNAEVGRWKGKRQLKTSQWKICIC